ncbi:hypothetical protein B9Q17_13070 [Marinobacter vinifirmus]|uniref:Uncharacterized protein n=1 Tax=Marinobacter vinifirmus TaxID=355591 RepID=A0A7Z1ILN8_9GAMM|nr:hypothetical protein B9Q17_13070 [Marinobacter vinifirmus]
MVCGRFPGALGREALPPMVQLVVSFQYPVKRRLRGEVQPLVHQRWYDLRRRKTLVTGRVAGRQDPLSLLFTEPVCRTGAYRFRALIRLHRAFTEPAPIGAQANAGFTTGPE